MVYASGNVYIGDWKNNLKDGFGKMIFKDRNEQYIGFWKVCLNHNNTIKF